LREFEIAGLAALYLQGDLLYIYAMDEIMLNSGTKPLLNIVVEEILTDIY
jgi:hypothetical protein